MKLKEILKQKNVKQADLARYLNLPTSQISNYANNKFEPSLTVLFKIADYLHVTTDELLGRDINLVNLASLDVNSQKLINLILEMSPSEVYKLISIVNIIKS